MNPYMKAMASVAVVGIMLASGYNAIFASASYKEGTGDACIPFEPLKDDARGLVSASGALPDCLDFNFPRENPENKWVLSARKVLARIESLEARLDRISPAERSEVDSALAAAQDGHDAAGSPGCAVEAVVRRMKRIAGAFRRLDDGQKEMLAELSVERKIEILEDISSRTEKIDAFIIHLQNRRKECVDTAKRAEEASAHAVEAVSGPDRGQVPSGAGEAARTEAPPDSGAREDASGFLPPDPAERKESPAPESNDGDVAASDDERIMAAAEAVAADILKVAECVALKSAAREETAYMGNMRGDMGQVTLWKLLAKNRPGRNPAEDLFCCETARQPHERRIHDSMADRMK